MRFKEYFQIVAKSTISAAIILLLLVFVVYGVFWLINSSTSPVEDIFWEYSFIYNPPFLDSYSLSICQTKQKNSCFEIFAESSIVINNRCYIVLYSPKITLSRSPTDDAAFEISNSSSFHTEYIWKISSGGVHLNNELIPRYFVIQKDNPLITELNSSFRPIHWSVTQEDILALKTLIGTQVVEVWKIRFTSHLDSEIYTDPLAGKAYDALLYYRTHPNSFSGHFSP